MSKIFEYFDAWKDERLTCGNCGWVGTIDPSSLDESRELAEFRCPACGTLVAIVRYPAEQEIRQNGSRLDRTQQAWFGRAIKRTHELQATHLVSPNQLPTIDDDPVLLVWDFEIVGEDEIAGEVFTEIKHQGSVIWRELAAYECAGRYVEVVRILKEKYGARLHDVIPSGASKTYLLGDDHSAHTKITTAREALGSRDVSPAARIAALASANDRTALNILRYEREIQPKKLSSPQQLPDLPDGDLVLTWDLAQRPPVVSVQLEESGEEHYDWNTDETGRIATGDGFVYATLSAGAQVLWEEPAGPDHIFREEYGDACPRFERRYEELVEVLKAKYGLRVTDLKPTARSLAYIHGASGEFRSIRRKHFPQTDLRYA